MYPRPYPIIPYRDYLLDSAPVIPKFYWDTYSQEQRIKRLCEELHKLVCYANELGVAINLDHDIIEQLEADFEKFKESGFFDYYAEQIREWINANMPDIIAQSIKMVFFGLTDDGYFCAYIPESWSEIHFDTGMVYGRFDYGRLILRYDVDGSDVIDNTGRYDDSSTEGILLRLADLERRVNRNDGTLYTEINHGGE